jgi:hypothetical protein
VDADDRTFMRELVLRHEKSTEAMIRRLDRVTDRLDAQTVVLHRLASDMDTHRREFVEGMRAQRQALFRIIDRLDGGGAAAGA